MSITLKVARAQGARNQTAPGRGRGDPGLFGSVFRAVTGVAKMIPGPIGIAASAAQRLAGKSASPGTGPMPAWGAGRGAWLSARGMMPGSGGQGPMPIATPGITGFMQRTIPGGATGFQAPPAEIGSPSGYHVNKTAYFLKDGTFIEAGSRWVRNRKRNPLNPRAASKAIGRIESLKKATARFGRITIRKKPC